MVEERLKALASEHEPRITALQRSVRDGVPGAKAELRRAKRTYAAARREVAKMRGRGVAW
jgi:hypothetical protein